MLRAKKRWKVAKQSHTVEKQLTNDLKISSIVANLLLNRGIFTAEEANNFLYIENTEFHDPYLMKGMRQAVERIHSATEKREKILIFGDYDADGVSSTAVMVEALKHLGADIQFYIPNRFTEGYGPNEPALRKAKESGFSLVITVDTGISAVHEAIIAKEIGLDLIITDHHEPPPNLPEALAIVNPKQKDCFYPFKGLAGVGVAFKLAHALLGQPPEHLLDLVVIGTIADLVPLKDENRLIAKKGLKALRKSRRPGLLALKKVAGIDDNELTADHVGFGIGPRINAAGRLASATPAVELLLSEDQSDAHRLANEIDELNRKRKGIVNQITEAAIEIVENQYASIEEHKVLVIAEKDWNSGVIGIVASRLVERYYRPTIILSIDEEKGIAKGSARSIEGFDMFKNLSESRDILPHFGGHPMAAGLTMKLTDLEELRKRLNKQASEVLTDEDYLPIITVDVTVSIKDITLPIIEEMSLLAPFGISNPTPKILIKDANLAQMRRIGSEDKHLKMVLEECGQTVECIGFHCGHLYDEISKIAKVSAIGSLSINEWNGHSKPQLMIEDVAVDDWQLFDLRGTGNIKKFLGLSKGKAVCIYFNKNTKTALSLDDEECDLIFIADEETATEFDFTGKYLYFLDLPSEKKQIEQLFSSSKKPERIYAIFYHNEEHFFTTIPSREHFKWLYGFLAQRPDFDLNKYKHQLAKHKGWSKDTIDFMIEVFFELEFVTIKNGLISLSTISDKKELKQSIIYKRKQEQANLENELYYSSYNELRNWFDHFLSQVFVNVN